PPPSSPTRRSSDLEQRDEGLEKRLVGGSRRRLHHRHPACGRTLRHAHCRISCGDRHYHRESRSVPRHGRRIIFGLDETMTREAFIAAYVRTPFTFARKGALAAVRPEELGAHAIRELVARTGVPASEIED